MALSRRANCLEKKNRLILTILQVPMENSFCFLLLLVFFLRCVKNFPLKLPTYYQQNEKNKDNLIKTIKKRLCCLFRYNSHSTVTNKIKNFILSFCKYKKGDFKIPFDHHSC